MSKTDDKICFDDKTNANAFKEFYWNLAYHLVAKLFPPSNGFGLDTLGNCYQNILCLLLSEFKFSNVTEDLRLQLLKGMNIEKAAGVDNLSGNLKKMEQISWQNRSLKFVIFPRNI